MDYDSPEAHLSLDQFELIHDEEEDGTLGKGSFGQVQKIRKKNTDKIYALKTIKKHEVVEGNLIDQVEREIEVQKNLKHHNVLRMYKHFEDTNNVYLLLEYCSKGELYQIMRTRKGRRFSEPCACKYFTQVVAGLAYLHSQNIVHRDIKPENLLVNHDEVIKIADFGWCAVMQTPRTTFCGTLDYLAPEMIQGKGHDQTLDLWGLGVLLYEMVAGKPPFQSTNHAQLITKILTLDFRFPPHMSPEVSDLVRKLLRRDPLERLPLEEVLRHPWVQRSPRHLPEKIEVDVRKRRDPTSKGSSLQSTADEGTSHKTSGASEASPLRLRGASEKEKGWVSSDGMSWAEVREDIPVSTRQVPFSPSHRSQRREEPASPMLDSRRKLACTKPIEKGRSSQSLEKPQWVPAATVCKRTVMASPLIPSRDLRSEMRAMSPIPVAKMSGDAYIYGRSPLPASRPITVSAAAVAAATAHGVQRGRKGKVVFENSRQAGFVSPVYVPRTVEEVTTCEDHSRCKSTGPLYRRPLDRSATPLSLEANVPAPVMMSNPYTVDLDPKQTSRVIRRAPVHYYPDYAYATPAYPFNGYRFR